MKILMLKGYFYPEKCAGISLSQDLISGFLEEGWYVDVFTPIPCRGINEEIRNKYKSKKIEKKGNLTIFRYWLPVEKSNKLQRACRYFLQNFIQLMKGMKYEYDVVFLGSTPPTMGIVGTIIKKIKKIKFIYNVQDIFPDSLVTTGITKKNSFLWKIGRVIEKITYKNADKIIVISESFKENLLNKGVPKEKIEVISNWIDLDDISPIKKENNNLFNEFNLDCNKFNVVYAGNFGASQGANILLKVAKKLEEYNDIRFIIFGGGQYFENAQKEAKKLKNIFIHELMPSNRVSEVYSLGNVAIITCKEGTGGICLPSKTWNIMACNTPIIASFDIDSDLANIIEKSGAGNCVPAEDVDALSKAILDAYKEERKTVDLRSYVEKNASKETCVKKYIEVIKNIKK